MNVDRQCSGVLSGRLAAMAVSFVWFVFGITALILAVPAPVSADPFIRCQVTAGSTVQSPVSNPAGCSTSQTDNYSTTKAVSIGDDQFVTFSYSQSAQASVSATLGSLHGQATASATDSPDYYEYTDADGNAAIQTNTLVEPGEGGSGLASWSDTLTLENSDHNNSEVEFQVTLTLNATATTSNCSEGSFGSTDAGAIASAYLFGAGESFQGGGTTLQVVQDACGGSTPTETLKAIIAEPGGSGIDIAGALNIGAEAATGYPNPAAPDLNAFVQSSSASVSALDTASVYIDPLTPGAYYTDSTGAIDFLETPASGGTGMPEPGSLALLALGLPFLAALRNRWRPRPHAA
jgi:hypothetical protein